MPRAAIVDTRNFTRRDLPALAFTEVASAVLPGWEISLVFAGETRAQSLNIALRGKDYVPNVLSYESGPKSGEIIICLSVADRQAPSYDLSVSNYVLYLFIHGLLHLKGLPHGATMERYERTYLVRFGSLRTIPSSWHDASQPASISERTKRKSSSSRR